MPTLHGVQVQDVGFGILTKFKARVAHYDQTPVQGIMDRNKQKVFAEYVHTLHSTKYARLRSQNILGKDTVKGSRW